MPDYALHQLVGNIVAVSHGRDLAIERYHAALEFNNALECAHIPTIAYTYNDVRSNMMMGRRRKHE